jgi:hypothetical protein
LGDDSIWHCEGQNKDCLNVYLFLNVTETKPVCISGYNSVRFLFEGLDKERSLQEKKVDTPDELLASIFDVAVRIKRRNDRFRQTTTDLRTRVAKCIVVDGGIFEHILPTVTYRVIKKSLCTW